MLEVTFGEKYIEVRYPSFSEELEYFQINNELIAKLLGILLFTTIVITHLNNSTLS